jgi:hypothetical protein
LRDELFETVGELSAVGEAMTLDGQCGHGGAATGFERREAVGNFFQRGEQEEAKEFWGISAGRGMSLLE